MTTKSLWDNQVTQWALEYGQAKSKNKKFFRPTLITLNERCRKCNSTANVRQHKGEEFYFARMYPDKYAARYIEFRPTDIVWLCNKCHVKAHKKNVKLRREMYILISVREDKPPLTIKECERFRIGFRKICHKWLKRKTKRRK